MSSTTNISAGDQPWLPTVTEFSLDSGPAGIFIDVPNTQSMLMEISFRAGRYLCLEDKPEKPHFLEHLLLGANGLYTSKDEFRRAALAKGAHINAFTGFYNIRHHFQAPDFDWQRVFDLALVSVSHPLFLPEEFESEREAIRQEHKMRLDDYSWVIQRLVAKRIGLPTVTHEECLESLDSISLDDLKDYYGSLYTLGNSRLMIAGCLPQERQDLIKQKLAGFGLPAGDRQPMPVGDLAGVGLVYVESAKAETVHYNLVFTRQGLSLGPEDEIALELLRHLWTGLSDSRIYALARSRGLIYAIGSGFDRTSSSAYFEFAGQVTPDKFEPLLDLIMAEIDRLLVGDLSDEEVNSGKDYLRGRFQLRPFTPASWGKYYLKGYLDYGLLLQADYPSRLEPVDRSAVVNLARKIFSPGDWTLGVLGNLPQETRKRIEDKFNRRRPAS